MYNIFKLPVDFLTRKYTPEQELKWDAAMHDAAFSSIQEELTDAQKTRVDNWAPMEPSTRKEHDRVFGEGNDRIILHYDTSEDPPISHDEIHKYAELHEPAITVRNTLEKHGYRIKDYGAGLAYHEDDEKQRPVKIGKVLEKTGEANLFTTHRSKDGNFLTVSQAYAADPLRASAKADKQIVITRNRYDVAGMSTGRGWTSCMNMVSGCNKKYLPNDIRQGTLTAYLTRKDDNGILNPIGRINLKKFVHADGHQIFRPENRSYGSNTPNFKKKISEWAQENYPSKEGIYMKHPSLYDDDGDSIKVEKSPSSGGMEAHLSTVRAMIRHHIDTQQQAFEQAQEKDHWTDYDYDEHTLAAKHDAARLVDKMYSNFEPAEYTKHIIHHLVDHAHDYDGDDYDREHDGFDNLGLNELRSHHILHHWARTRFNLAKPDQLSHSDAMDAIHNIHNAIKDTSNPESHTALKIIHRKLIHHLLNGNEEHRNAVLNHMFDDSASDYYASMMQQHFTPFHNHHPAKFTTNPRLIHTILNHPNLDAFPINELDNESAEHIGRHADMKLAHEFMSKSENEEHFAPFVRGLNHNKDGKEIQHKLTDDMYLHGGTATLGELKPIHSGHHKAEAVSGRHRERNVPDSTTDENRFAAIIANTAHHEVLGKLKHRQDITSGGVFDQHFAANKYLKEGTRPKTFATFLRSKG